METHSNSRSQIAEFQPEKDSPLPIALQKALFFARQLQERAAELQTPAEKRQQAELDRMLQNPQDKATLTQITDQGFRSSQAHRVSNQLIHILDVQGVPRFFSPLERTLLKGFQSFGAYLPGVAVPLVKERMRHETANVILPAEPEMLVAHLRERRQEGIRMNVNFLGEAILGEEEARRRLENYLEALQWPEIEVASVKISTLYSQISALAREHTIAVLCDRLELLYREAARMKFQRRDGSMVPKFVYLDMEEYRDMHLTAEAFMRTLDRPGLQNVSGGIALQAYIPDSFRVQKQINEWARRRVAVGGAPVVIRIVKGANMEMERVEASIKGWPQAPFKTKSETDANYKRILIEGMKPENIAAVRLGIASHNLFELAYGFAWASERGALDKVQFEMLEGMANAQRRALAELAQNILLYAPACRRGDFIHAIGYLTRRLDENTGPENFLRHAFKLDVGGEDWKRLQDGFLKSFELLPSLGEEPRRNQDRFALATRPAVRSWRNFVNEPDTDFSLPHHSAWAKQIIERWLPRCGERAIEVPLVIEGKEIIESREIRDCLDPSRPGAVVGRYRQATADDIARAVDCAVQDADGWRTMSPKSRHNILRNVAQEIRLARADLIGAAMANGGKTIQEADPEVSEAVDFLEFYAETARYFQELPTLRARGKGVVVVVPPWNFPIAIPCGGIAAALAAGNTVILKPASDAVLIAWELCQCFWRGGVSKKTLQFVPCSGGSGGRQLVAHPKVNAVILTGSTETALSMLRDKPEMHVVAETGGKNATVVTAMADRDLAITNVIHSAFSHAGQKCSATSLLLLEAEVYDDEKFKQTLCDAVESIPVGSVWELHNKMGPLIHAPRGDLENALKTLEPGESWAVMPRRLEENPNLWTPGVKYGVKPGSYTHLTEFFGPVLGVMRFDKLSEAIAMVNQTGYGLTSGLESLDDREQEIWKAGVRAGNLYINRSTVGAIVLRQPFGGLGKSAFGPGIKVGGPNYVAQFMDFEELIEARSHPRGSEDERFSGNPEIAEFASQLEDLLTEKKHELHSDLARVLTATKSYQSAFRQEFGRVHDHFKLVGQDNFRRYLPVCEMRIRIHPEDSTFEIFARVAAARVAGCRVTVSLPCDFHSETVDLLEQLTESWAAAIEFVEESDDELAVIMRGHQTERVRYADPKRVPLVVRQAGAGSYIYVADAPVMAEGRVELLWYLQEQSISMDYHRYGNLGARALETRAEVL